MDLRALPFDSPPEQYASQAEQLLSAHAAGDEAAIRLFHHQHPRFQDEKVRWLPLSIPESEIRNAVLDLPDAQLALARWYDFRDWASLVEFAGAVRDDSAVRAFETAVEAVVDGDAPGLQVLLGDHPELVCARSTRITHFDPPAHAATLLHYVAANGVEGHRQRTPANAVEIAKLLLKAGAAADALANMYGGQCTTMSMLVSSSHPARERVQVALVETLVDFGASVEAIGEGLWRSPIITALAFGSRDAAEALVRCGARIDDIAKAAGLGRLDDATRLLPVASPASRHMALALAAQLGQVEIVRLLLEAGEDPNRYNPEGSHAHATPLHQAALAGHTAVARLLVQSGAALDQKDKIHQATPLGWAVYGGQTEIAEYLRAQTPVSPGAV